MNKHSVDILLPTYNGSLYLRELLNSLKNQTYIDFRILWLDDGSEDDSSQIIGHYLKSLHIERVEKSTNQKGALSSFETLLEHATNDYIMFCDQDDIWDPLKIEIMLFRMNLLEKSNPNCPISIFCDLKIIDENSKIIKPSLSKIHRVNHLLLQDSYYISFLNPSPGCALMINREMKEAALPFGSNTVMHDWWILIIASLIGKIDYIQTPLVFYRVHNNNTIGINDENPAPILFSLLSFLNYKKFIKVFMQHQLAIKQSKQAFNRTGKSFSILRYFFNLVLGRWIFPTMGRFFTLFRRKSWRESNYG